MIDRRSFLKGFAALMAAWQNVPALAKPAPGAKLEQAIASATDGRGLLEAPAGRIRLETAEIAENGAIVPVTVESSFPDVTEILLFVEKNPTPLAARFRFEREMDAYASLRIKMNESCDVLAVVKSGQAFYVTRRRVKVMVGGCG